MENLKKYVAVAGLSAALTASAMSLYGDKYYVGSRGMMNSFEGMGLNDEDELLSKADVIEQKKVKNSTQILEAYNSYLRTNDSETTFTLEELENISDMKNFIEVTTQNPENPHVIICSNYKLYKLNNEKLVVLNPIKNTIVIDLLTGDEIVITDNTDLVPICDVKSFIEDFEIPSLGYDFNKVSIRNEELEKLTPDLTKQLACKEIGLIVKVYNSDDILKKYDELRVMPFTEQTLTKYNSCLKKYGQTIREQDLDLISSEFNDILDSEICLTKDEKTSIYDKNIINLIYSENGTSIVIAKIDEVNGQEVSPNFANIFNSIDIDPIGYVVDRGIHEISEDKKEELKEKYGEGLVEAIEHYGLPLVTYDTNEICQKYNEYKQSNILSLR